MKDSKIEWTTHIFNPWSGCTKVSEACAHCYAEALANRTNTLGGWGKGAPRRRTKPEYWRQPLRWNAAAAALGERPRVFCASLADWLDDDGVPLEWLADLLELVGQTPALDWLLLTKRPEKWRERVWNAAIVARDRGTLHRHSWLSDWVMHSIPPRNVWIGVTVENQARASRLWELCHIPAAVRFVSCEPLLGRLDLTRVEDEDNNTLNALSGAVGIEGRGWVERPEWSVHWVICGGESGHLARAMHPAWALALRNQCASEGVPFFFKQWGEWLPADDARAKGLTVPHHKQNMPFVVPPKMLRVGKEAAGRELDGREWNQFPEVRP